MSQFKATAESELKALVADVEETRREWSGKAMPDHVFTEWTAHVVQAETLLETLHGKRAAEKWSRKMTYSYDVDPEVAGRIPASPRMRGDVAGYLDLGSAIALSAGLQEFIDAGFPRHEVRIFSTKSLVDIGGRAFVPLSREERTIVEQKAVPTLGTGVIEPQRLPMVPQVTADQPLRLRDVIPVSTASSDSVTFLREESFTSGADYQLAGSPKGESTAEYSQQRANVQTIAHWVPVLVQQLADFGQLRMLVDSRLRYGVLLREEAEMVWGAGGDNAFEGLLTVTGTHDIATADARVTTPTILDSIRVGITEIRRAGYNPDTLLIDPLDLESILLLKASTEGQYLGGAFPSSDAGTGFKVWGLKVVESQAVAGSDNSRYLIVMDSRVACGLFMREALNVQVGLAEDDFIRNKRRLLAEERAAFAIFAPAAIAILETAAAS